MRRAVCVGLTVVAACGVLLGFVPRVDAQLVGPPPDFNPVRPELRALWVDAYHDGIKTRQQVDRLVADARRANVNALVVQIRRRGDAFFTRSIEPRTEDPDLPAGFDALDYLIERARTGSPRLEVHAWIATFPIWGSRERAPRDPSHIFNRHGPSSAGRDNWLSQRDDGETWASAYFLDPGHPDAARHTVEVALGIVREYDVDGIHLDYVRYPEGGAGHGWGYNETSVARFNARFGRTGQPDPSDPIWGQWRRDQVTAVVRQIYLGATALKPTIKVSAAVIPWGDGPRSTADWQRMAAYTTVFQDWRAWLEEGILDLAMPMNYFRESQPQQSGWFDRWVAWQREHAYGRHMVPGIALYLNSPSESVAQIRRALAPGPSGSRVAGVALYSYGANSLGPDGQPGEVMDPEMWGLLGVPGPGNQGSPLFAGPAPVPPSSWKISPSSGGMLVRVPGLDGASVEVRGPTLARGETDGSGVFGALSLAPGRYSIVVRHPSFSEPRTAELDVAGGAVAQLDL